MKKTVALLIAVATFWGCSEDLSQDNGDVPYDPSEAVSVTTQVAGDPATRGTMVGSEAQMVSLGVFCSYTGLNDWTASDVPGKMFNRRMNRNPGGGWVYASGNPEMWNAASANDRYTFFSYAPYATGNYNAVTNPTGNGIVVNGSAATQGVPTITYTVPSDCASQPDLMVAVARQNIRKSPSPVAFSMQHVLTSVGFKVTGTIGLVITKLTVTGVKNVGTLALDSSAVAWTNVSGTSDVDVKINTSLILGSTGQQLNTADGYLMMIPQTLGPAAKVVVTLSDNSTREASLNGQVWTAGKHIDYVMQVTRNGTIIVTPPTVSIPALGVIWGAQALTVTCQYPDQLWALSATDTWLLLSASALGTAAAQLLPGQGTKTIYIQAGLNLGASTRTTTITLSGATVVTVSQPRSIIP